MIDIQNIKAIIFDLGGVLIDINRAACVAELERIGIYDADDFLSCYVQSGVFLELEMGNITPRQFGDYMRERYNISATDKDIADALSVFLVGVPKEKLDMLLRLHAIEGVRVLMLSNTNEIMFPSAVKKFFEIEDRVLSDYFDAVYLSYEMHLAKPGEEIFKELLRREQLRADQCLFIDDGAQNIATAEKLGFNIYLAAEHDSLDFLL